MGGSITIDKHTTNLDQWLQISSKLESINFEAEITDHLSVWKLVHDQIRNQIKISPFSLHSKQQAWALSAEQCYVIGFIKKADFQRRNLMNSTIRQMASFIIHNIEESSYKNCIKSGSVGSYRFYTYSFNGNKSHNKVRLLSLTYALKLASLLNSENKLKILSGGGVYKGNKLQMGSCLPFMNEQKQQPLSNYQKFLNIHLIKLCYCFEQSRSGLNLIKHVPRLDIPTICSRQHVPNLPALEIPSKPTKTTKPPILKLNLKPYQQVTYENLAEEQSNGVMKFDIRATKRHELKMEKFGNDCTKIIDGLYVSGEKVARDLKSLKKNKISKIVNCAGDYCENWFENDPTFQYLTFFLKDSQNQNIQCLFYRVIDFINTAHRNQENVLVHCIQGISRSVTFVIAYLIFMNGFDYKKAESFVKEKRGIACPNNGFMVQLIQFYKRLYENYHSLPSPRVFLVSSHCAQTPGLITARMLKHNLFDKKKFISLDSRGLYIIQSQSVMYLWVGSQCDEQKRLKQYWAYAQNYIKKLQQHEKAPSKVKAVNQKNEGKQFLDLWEIDQIPEKYHYQEYQRLFPEQETAAKPGYIRKFYEYQEQNSSSDDQITKLFIYPNYEEGLGVFDIEELSNFSLLIKSSQQKISVFIWRSENWASDMSAEEKFFDEVLRKHYHGFDEDAISIHEQFPNQLSQQFLDCFS